MLLILALSVVTLMVVGAACTPTTITPESDGGFLLDGGAEAKQDAGIVPDAGASPCADNLPVGPPCCNESGSRVVSAECGDDGWTCDEGALCECDGEPASFICSDFCGSDAFADPTCSEQGWSCEGLIRSDSCEEDVCWGDPGNCCVNPSCVDGQWQCESIQDPCQ